MTAKTQPGSLDGGWPAAVAFAVGGGSNLIPSRPGQPSHVVHLPCSGPCKTTKEFHFAGKRLPPDAVVAKLKRLGWRTGRKLVCPTCNGHAPKPVQQEEVMAKTPVSLSVGTALSTMGTMPAPTPDARAVKRQIIEWLDLGYDLKNQQYKDDFSDESIAKETGAAVSHVSQMREDLYGPAQPPEPKEVTRLREDIKAAEADLKEYGQKITDVGKRIEGLYGRLDQLAMKNAWRT